MDGSDGEARTKHDAVVGALIEVATSDSLRVVAPAMKSIRKISGAILYRGELYHEMLRALSEFDAGEYADLREAAWATRNRTSHMGRRLSNCRFAASKVKLWPPMQPPQVTQLARSG